ncbi:baseplate J/gp47 family protein [Vicingaceae bacterium]|nr:baseplate J/gp47 family protein [Vicingaceae bacterium]
MGITNLSQTSKVKLLTDIFSDEISNMAEAQNNSILGLRSDTATDDDLDIKGAQYGVYRKIKDSIYIDKADVIAFIKPKVSGETFGDTVRQSIIIQSGEKISIGSDFYIIISEDVNIEPSASLVAISGTITTSTKSGFKVNSGDVFKMSGSNRVGNNLNTLVLEFDKPISIEGGFETDVDLRKRVILARDGDNIATAPAVRSAITSLPDISGYVFLENKRGSGSLDIGITTETLQNKSIDNDISSTIQLLRSRMVEVAPLGVDVFIFEPAKLDLAIEYTSDNSDISEENIKSAILESFINVYSYNALNQVVVKDLEREIYELIPSANIYLSLLSLYDPAISANLSTSNDKVIAPQSYFVHLDIDSISRG